MVHGGTFLFHLLISCFIFVRLEHSPCAKPLTNTTSWRKKIIKQQSVFSSSFTGPQHDGQLHSACVVSSRAMQSLRLVTLALVAASQQTRLPLKELQLWNFHCPQICVDGRSLALLHHWQIKDSVDDTLRDTLLGMIWTTSAISATTNGTGTWTICSTARC